MSLTVNSTPCAIRQSGLRRSGVAHGANISTVPVAELYAHQSARLNPDSA